MNVSLRSPEVCNGGRKEPSVASGQKVTKSQKEIDVWRLFLTVGGNLSFSAQRRGAQGFAFREVFAHAYVYTHIYTYGCIHTIVYIRRHTYRLNLALRSPEVRIINDYFRFLLFFPGRGNRFLVGSAPGGRNNSEEIPCVSSRTSTYRCKHTYDR